MPTKCRDDSWGLPPGSVHSALGGQQTKDCQGLSMGTKVLIAVSALSRLSGTKHGHISTKDQNQAGPLKTFFFSEENGSLTGQGEGRLSKSVGVIRTSPLYCRETLCGYCRKAKGPPSPAQSVLYLIEGSVILTGRV